MKIENLFAKRVTVADGLKVTLSPHFAYSVFGVRGRYDTVTSIGMYVPSLYPGTGFFAHPSDSKSYRLFVNEQKALTKQNLWTLIRGKECSFEKESVKLEQAINNATGINKTVLLTYQNAFQLAKEAESVARIVDAVKELIHRKHSNKYLVSVLSHYKNRYATLQHQVKSVQLHTDKVLTDEAMEKWKAVMEAFGKLVEARRIWHVVQEDGRESYHQVHFDLGIFNYMASPFDTPVMRDKDNVHYYLYSSMIIKARSNVDFDVIPLRDLEIEYSTVDLNTLETMPTFQALQQKKHRHKHHHSDHTDATSTLFATSGRDQVVGQILIPQMNLAFFVNRTGPAQDFVKAIREFQPYAVSPEELLGM